MREAPLLEAQPRIAQPHLYFRHKVLIESCPPRPQALGADGLPETPGLPLGARVCVRQVRPMHQDKDIVSAVQATAMKNYLRAPRNRSDVKKILCVCVCVCVCRGARRAGDKHEWAERDTGHWRTDTSPPPSEAEETGQVQWDPKSLRLAPPLQNSKCCIFSSESKRQSWHNSYQSCDVKWATHTHTHTHTYTHGQDTGRTAGSNINLSLPRGCLIYPPRPSWEVRTITTFFVKVRKARVTGF